MRKILPKSRIALTLLFAGFTAFLLVTVILASSFFLGVGDENNKAVSINEVKVVKMPEGFAKPSPREMITSPNRAEEIVVSYLENKFGPEFFKKHFTIMGVNETDIPHVWFVTLEYKSGSYSVKMHVALDTWWKDIGAERISFGLSNIINEPQEILVSREEAENIASKEGLPQPYISMLEVRHGRIVWVVTSQNFEEYPAGYIIRIVIDAENGTILERIQKPPYISPPSSNSNINTKQSINNQYSTFFQNNLENETSPEIIQQNLSSSNIYIYQVINWISPPSKLILGQDQNFEAWGCNVDTNTHKLYFKFFLTAPNGESTSAESGHLDINPGYCLVYDVTVSGSWAASRGIGISSFRFELWEDIPLWFDTKHDEYNNEYWTVFQKPFESTVYYCDNYWHHPSDINIIRTALSAAAGKTTPRDAANALKTYVYNYVTYDANYMERSSDLEVLQTRRGVCVDFANLYIGLARSLNIPTRHVVGYTFGSTCQLSNVCGAYCSSVGTCWGHAWAESYYGGNWHHVDPTWNTMENPRVYLGVSGAEHIHASAYTLCEDPYTQGCSWVYDSDTVRNGHIDVTLVTDGGYDSYYYCPFDLDKDGVCDNRDSDRDNDGIPNESDQCICQWGHSCNGGCPDTSPPGRPSPSCQGGGNWINDSTPTISWSPVSDVGCGVSGYEYAIDQTTSWTNIGYKTSFETPPLSSGTHTVNVRAYDGAGNRGDYGSCSVSIDTTSPSNPTTITSNPPKDQWTTQTSVTFSWSGASDSYSGVKGYYYKIDKNSGTNVGTSDSFTSGTSVTQNLGHGQWYLHIRTVDNAGNLATETKHYGPVKIDITPPAPAVGETKINDGAEYTNNPTVTVHFVAMDGDSGFKRYYFSNDGIGWTLIEEFVPPIVGVKEVWKSWTLPPGDGVKCVYIDLEDALGNRWWPNPPSNVYQDLRDCITLDTTPPPAPALLSPADKSRFLQYQVILSWQGVSDPSPGKLGQYIVEIDTSTSFSTPDKKTYTTTSTSITIDIPKTGTWYWRVRAVDQAGNMGPWSVVASFQVIGNPDNDNRGDLAIWRPSNGYWYILTSSTEYNRDKRFQVQWGSGALGDIPLIGRFDSDRMEDLVIWRPSNGYWYILKSTTSYDPAQALRIQWGSGSLGDIPLTGDIDGDGVNDLIVWRPSNGYWYILKSTTSYDRNQAIRIQWGTSGDKPLVGDVDGDGKGDLIIWRPSNGYWYILLSSKGYSASYALRIQWGSGSLGDIPLIGRIDGDSKGEIIIWRPSNGYWYILKSSANYDPAQALRIQWGTSGDIPLIGDIDGDSVSDLIVWRPSNGYWYILKSTTSYDRNQAIRIQWGTNGDVPLAS